MHITDHTHMQNSDRNGLSARQATLILHKITPTDRRNIEIITVLNSYSRVLVNICGKQVETVGFTYIHDFQVSVELRCFPGTKTCATISACIWVNTC
jgi:hypothetical protein